MTGTPLRSGVRRVLGPADVVATELRERGWTVAVVPPAATDDALWDGMTAALGLPGWFGRNLDALDEVLADRQRPTALVLQRWWTYARARPERWTRLLDVLRDHVRPGTPFLVALTD